MGRDTSAITLSSIRQILISSVYKKQASHFSCQITGLYLPKVMTDDEGFLRLEFFERVENAKGTRVDI